jgi:holliday junction DNA helicase RuvA
MIAHLRGRLLSKEPNRIVIEAAGVGYEVVVSIPTFTELPGVGNEVAVHIHTHVREDALALFGFLRLPEKQLFERLISVSGIGPKLAVTILSGMSTEFLVAAIRGNDVGSLTRIPGIGKKTAERMVLELRDKLQALPAAAVPSATPVEADVLSALMNLGYQQAAAEKAVAKAREQGSTDGFESMFRQALALLRR